MILYYTLYLVTQYLIKKIHTIWQEIIPGFKFSRAAYLAGLLRPTIIKDLNLEKYGFKYLSRNPSSFTPTLESSIYKGKLTRISLLILFISFSLLLYFYHLSLPLSLCFYIFLFYGYALSTITFFIEYHLLIFVNIIIF